MNKPIFITLPLTNSFRRNVELLAAHHDNITNEGQGIFFNFKRAREYIKPVLNLLVERYGWVMERPFFIRKPEL